MYIVENTFYLMGGFMIMTLYLIIVGILLPFCIVLKKDIRNQRNHEKDVHGVKTEVKAGICIFISIFMILTDSFSDLLLFQFATSILVAGVLDKWKEDGELFSKKYE